MTYLELFWCVPSQGEIVDWLEEYYDGGEVNDEDLKEVDKLYDILDQLSEKYENSSSDDKTVACISEEIDDFNYHFLTERPDDEGTWWSNSPSSIIRLTNKALSKLLDP